jgi:hypothetical protein
MKILQKAIAKIVPRKMGNPDFQGDCFNGKVRRFATTSKMDFQGDCFNGKVRRFATTSKWTFREIASTAKRAVSQRHQNGLSGRLLQQQSAPFRNDIKNGLSERLLQRQSALFRNDIKIDRKELILNPKHRFA